MDKYFGEDIVALKVDPSITGAIVATWLDLDPMVKVPDNWITHADTGPLQNALDECIETGKPPENYVIVEFFAPYSGTAMINKHALILLDRGLCVGDVVKLRPSDSQSGTITNVHAKYKLQPIYTDLPYQGSEPWPYKPEDNEFWASADDVCHWDVRDADYVAYKGWIGQVVGIKEEVTVRLQDGSVVRVNEPEDLESPVWAGIYRHVNRRWLEGNTLSHNLRKVRKMLSETVDRDALALPETFYPGLKVQTKKSNLRLGSWISGSYNASIPPKGVVVETRVVELDVEWETTNVFDTASMRTLPPSNLLGSSELDNVRRCDSHLPSSSYGSRFTGELMAGDRCRFRDEPAAAIKYSANEGEGCFRRIPRTQTQGFNMNTFGILETRTIIDVQWQDGTSSTLDSKTVVPYLNVDEHDLWPGEPVSVRDQEVATEGIIRAHKIGIVQTVDATDRVATVKWYRDADVSYFEQAPQTLVPGSHCGELSAEVSTVSVYEVVGLDAILKRRGDIVLLSPDLTQTTPNIQPPSGTTSAAPTSWLSLLAAAAGTLVSGPVITTETEEGLPWVGEVVDLGLDGYLTVRLAAIDKPRDVRVRADKVLMVIGIDDREDAEDDEDESMDDFVSDDEDSWASADVIEERIEYEGGERLDNGDEEAWQTDSSEGEGQTVESDGDVKMSGTDSQPPPETPATNEPVVNPSTPVSTSAGRAEYGFNDYESMPPQFLVLDEPPPSDHHFVSHEHSWNAPGMLRRIRKEHKLLQTSLPRGIWVRTWADRLDLLRILIVGPRGTPYALAPFVFDFAFDNNFPKSPPEAFFHSWTNFTGRINPNLYEDGKVCLSVLGTWPGSDKTESWNAEHSSMLQVLVSLLGLVLVERPYYNEAGFESLVGTEDNLVNEKVYSEKALVMAKGFVVRSLRSPVSGLSDVIEWVYRSSEGPQMLRSVVDEARKLRDQGSAPGEEKLSRGILIILERHLPVLESMLDTI